MKKLLVIILILFALVSFTCLLYTIIAGNSFQGFQGDGGGDGDKSSSLQGDAFLSTIPLFEEIPNGLGKEKIENSVLLSPLFLFIPFLLS